VLLASDVNLEELVNPFPKDVDDVDAFEINDVIIVGLKKVIIFIGAGSVVLPHRALPSRLPPSWGSIR